MNFGSRIKERLKVIGLTQKDLAKLLGVHENTVSYWITGKKEPGLLKAYMMCHYLECDLNWLISGKERRTEQKTKVAELNIEYRNRDRIREQIQAMVQSLDTEELKAVYAILKLLSQKRGGKL